MVTTDQAHVEVHRDRLHRFYQLANSPSTDQVHLVNTPLRMVTWIWTLILMLIRSTCLPVVLIRKGGYLIQITTSLLQTPTILFQKSSHIEKLYMGSDLSWAGLIPDVDDSSSSPDNNPFAASKQQPLGRISVKLPTDEWLCKKMDKLNITLVESYSSRVSEAGGLQKDQFVKVSRSQSKWYGLHPNTEKPAGSVSFWGSESVKLSSSCSRITRPSGLSTPAPASCPFSQDTLIRWDKSVRECTYICNQVAGFSRKSSEKTSSATDEL